MKLTTFILIVALVQVSARGFGQKITLSTNNTPIEKVIQQIREQSGYSVFYNAEDLNNEKLSLKLNNATIEQAIQAMIKGLPLSYKIVKNNVVLMKESPSLLDKLASVIQNNLVIQNGVKDLNVKGRVVDQDGKPLPNASIRVKGKNTVTNTNQDGEFEIKNVADDAVLLVSYVGFRTLELPLKDAVMPLEIKLNVATGELEEVKIVYDDGYQKLNKERSTGSFVHIDNELFNRTVGTNVLDRILYVTSGLVSGIASGNSSNNSRTQIAIRGLSTINAGKDPLIVVDNFPYEGDLNTLNPNDDKKLTMTRV